MTSKQKLQIKNKIKKDLENLENEIYNLQIKITPITKDCSLDNINRKDMLQEQHIFKKIIDDAQIRKNKLQKALKRVDSEKYGVCQECEEDIAIGRLMLLPESIYCVSCKSEMQKL